MICPTTSFSGSRSPATSSPRRLRGESTQRYAEQIIATGYLAISRRFGFDSENYHHLTIQDTIDTVGQSVMGLSLGCARCHDHKFDPISVRDYHALYGIFESSRYPFPGSEQKQRVRSLAPLVSPHANERRWRDFQTDVARLSQELASLDRSPPTATLRSVTDIDGDFELQAPAHGGSNGVLVAPWRYEGAIAVTAAAQSPFQHLHPGGRCGVSVAAGAGPYRCTQSLRPAPQGSGALRYINLDIRTASPTADAAGRHRFTIGDWHESAVEIVIAAESLSLHADGEVSELGSFPPGQWINLQLVIDTTGRSVSGRYGRPGSVREFGPFRLGSAWAGEIDHRGTRVGCRPCCRRCYRPCYRPWPRHTARRADRLRQYRGAVVSDRPGEHRTPRDRRIER